MQRIFKVTSVDEKAPSDGPAVVFGEAGKLRSEGPYLELPLAWSAELRLADSLVVVGYSFRDQHVNEVIARWFHADARRRITVVDPRNLDSAEYLSFVWHLAQLPDRFEYIEGRASESLARAIAAGAVSPAATQS